MLPSKGFHLLAWISLGFIVQGTGHAQDVQKAPSIPITVLICYPGGSAQSRDAEAARETMLRIVEEAGNWPAGSMKSLFTTAVGECGTHLDQQQPPFAITTLGTFLAYRAKLSLIPLVQPVTGGSSVERYRIVVRRGTFTSLQELKGKTLGGSLVEEPAFLGRVILQGRVDPESFFSLRGSRRVLRDLRALAKGDLDGVIVNSRQYRALASLPFAGELEVAFTSEEVPLVGVVASKEKTTEDERSRFSRALSKLCNREEGRKLCELFGVETFVPADIRSFQKVIDLWQAPDSSPGGHP